MSKWSLFIPTAIVLAVTQVSSAWGYMTTGVRGAFFIESMLHLNYISGGSHKYVKVQFNNSVNKVFGINFYYCLHHY